MDNGLIITKNKILYKYWDIELEKPKYCTKTVDPKNLIHYLWEEVTLNKVTLGRIFEIVEPLVELWSTVLNERLIPLITEMKETWVPDKSKRDLEELLFLELYWGASYDDDDKVIDIWPSLHAYGNDTEKEGIYYGISFTPVNSMKDLVIKLKKDFKITYDFKDVPPKEFGKRSFKLIEFMKGIFWELTWYGTPQKRDETMKEILNTVDEIKDEELLNEIKLSITD